MTTTLSGRRPAVSDEGRYERLAIARVTETLCAQFAGRVPPAAVKAAVAEAHGHFEAARVREFVPVLVERSARRRLAMTVSS
ncbi:three-helix bundle dimerization domain-containing protein [Rugosimonospora africana]|uniref:Uncharacterized protein n=1 Tax=Rugosimonospora africana TaxID=556532 RepID=A0A8J3R3L0_9ACTN|nr:hypothetical protein [Rugosimonospora africana]GIH21098.1 hypothetical protein Raf01_92700 [Rugosimonospora africana]